MTVSSTARAFAGPAKYIQGPGEFDNLQSHTTVFGKRALALIDGFLFDSLAKRLEVVYGGSGEECRALRFGGECCEEEWRRLEEEVKRFGADAVVGVGGGKTIDTIKIVANNLGLPLVVVPTSASTDAPTSAMSVIYTKDGVYLGNVRHKRHADLVLMDSSVIAKAPIRLFVAGMGDALATYFEALANERSDSANYIGKGYRRTRASMAIARMCHEILMRDGRAAKTALENGACSEAVENVIEANTLLSGLGFENAGCACAHGIHSGLTEIPSTHKFYHGEKVAFGILCQLALENAPPALVEETLGFMTAVDLPCTLADLDVEATGENVQAIARKTAVDNKLIQAEPFLITEESVRNAILAADGLGKRYKAAFSKR